MTLTLTADHAAALADAMLGPLRASTSRGNAWVSARAPAVLRHDRVTIARLLTAGMLAARRDGLVIITLPGRAALQAYESERRARQFANPLKAPAGAGAAADRAPRAA